MSGDKGCSRAVDFQNKISYNEVIVNVKGNIMATLKDIAKEAGVSAMTVSRVMNGNSRAVSEQTGRFEELQRSWDMCRIPQPEHWYPILPD